VDKKSIPLELDWQGTHYNGWATPAEKMHPDGYAKSYHVVLNEVFFGDLSHIQDKWTIDQQRPHDLVVAIGHCLDRVVKGV
jgi:hypothetical protein